MSVKEVSGLKQKLRITILYDNTAWDQNLIPDWGFSCLVDSGDQKILFDTGAKTDILAGNMKKLGIDPFQIDAVFISHDHWDHTGGLHAVLGENQVRVYVPESFAGDGDMPGIIRIREPQEIAEDLYSTGDLKQIEQSLVIRLENNEVTVVAGCSHPGVREIVKAASMFGNVTSLIGGLHGFKDFELIDSLKSICPTHCTQYISEITTRYPQKVIPGGAGRVIVL
jgi:7,8-dihydropterin-6-yl-methyl-4-(beta-D-ribofuranosyl)aminobenzene 5'-phosphate synthase